MDITGVSVSALFFLDESSHAMVLYILEVIAHHTII